MPTEKSNIMSLFKNENKLIIEFAIKNIFTELIITDETNNFNINILNNLKDNIINLIHKINKFTNSTNDTDKHYVSKNIIKIEKTLLYLKNIYYTLHILNQIEKIKNNLKFIVDSYIYKSLGDLYLKLNSVNKKDFEKKTKNIIDREYKLHLIDFIDEIKKFIFDIIDIIDEFYKFNIELPYIYIKIFINQLYYNYLNTDSKTLPISLKLQSYYYKNINVNESIDTLYHFLKSKNAQYMELIKEELIIIDSNKFNSCVETNLFNLITAGRVIEPRA
jgi:hypothetical protein